MRIRYIEKCNISERHPSFKAGITNLYSDFDGTFMPYEYRHDVFCRLDGKGPRTQFLKNGKTSFQEYFDGFNEFIQTAKGEKGNKFNFTITSGRNRPEYNYYMKRIREDGLAIPLPDRLIIKNGGDIYKKRRDVQDFFKSDVSEAFLKKDYDKSKRKLIKLETYGWNGRKIRHVINKFFKDITLKPSWDAQGNNKNRIVIFEAETEGVFYGNGMHFRDKLNTMNPKPDNYAVMKENGNLEFDIILPYHLGNDKNIKSIKENLVKKIKKKRLSLYSKSYCAKNEGDFGLIKILPKINGKKNDKFYDVKAQVKDISDRCLNDVVIAAGDDGNDARMLNLFEYIKEGQISYKFNKDNLEEIYNLPLIAVYVDNSILKGKKVIDPGNLDIPFDKIDNYFNSDGNVRFIHVIPGNNIGKPQTLQEGIQVAIKEYAKRNKTYRDQLPIEIQKLIENSTYEYPIDKTVSETLEAQFGAKLWNPAPALEKIAHEQTQNVKNSVFNKKTAAILAISISLLTLGLLLINKILQNKRNNN